MLSLAPYHMPHQMHCTCTCTQRQDKYRVFGPFVNLLQSPQAVATDRAPVCCSRTQRRLKKSNFCSTRTPPQAAVTKSAHVCCSRTQRSLKNSNSFSTRTLPQAAVAKSANVCCSRTQRRLEHRSSFVPLERLHKRPSPKVHMFAAAGHSAG